METVQPRNGTLLNWWHRVTAHIRRPGVLLVICLAAMVLAWRTFVLMRPSLVLSLLVLLQIMLLLCSYRFPIPALIMCCVTILLTDVIEPRYSDYSLYAVLTVLGLWAYQTDIAATIAAIMILSAYQLIWSYIFTGSDVVTTPLFGVTLILSAALGALLRSIVRRIHRQHRTIQRMHASICRAALDLHDAVSGNLTRADLVLQQQELSLTSSFEQSRSILEQNHVVRSQLDEAAENVAHLVDLLLEQHGGNNVPAYDSMVIARLREQLAQYDQLAVSRKISAQSNCIIDPDARIDKHKQRVLHRKIQTLFENIILPYALQYEVSVYADSLSTSITCVMTCRTSKDAQYIKSCACIRHLVRNNSRFDCDVRGDRCTLYGEL